jgi:methylated-DNA-[protein]-cysteine S-methyltransferase
MSSERSSLSLFRQRVYAAVRNIPRGRVTTYKALAAYISCRSNQAVGQALRSNPFAPQVPCHRVIKSDLTPGGFMGHSRGSNINHKIDLLRAEGVLFQDGRLANPNQLIWCDDAEL